MYCRSDRSSSSHLSWTRSCTATAQFAILHFWHTQQCMLATQQTAHTHTHTHTQTQRSARDTGAFSIVPMTLHHSSCNSAKINKREKRHSAFLFCQIKSQLSRRFQCLFHPSLPVSTRGFCYFNSVAIAARKLQHRLSVSKILIVDWVRGLVVVVYID